jgi:hypothetical protein
VIGVVGVMRWIDLGRKPAASQSHNHRRRRLFGFRVVAMEPPKYFAKDIVWYAPACLDV